MVTENTELALLSKLATLVNEAGGEEKASIRPTAQGRPALVVTVGDKQYLLTAQEWDEADYEAHRAKKYAS